MIIRNNLIVRFMTVMNNNNKNEKLSIEIMVLTVRKKMLTINSIIRKNNLTKLLMLNSNEDCNSK